MSPTRRDWPSWKSATTCWRACRVHDLLRCGSTTRQRRAGCVEVMLASPRGLDERFEGLQPDLLAYLSPRMFAQRSEGARAPADASRRSRPCPCRRGHCGRSRRSVVRFVARVLADEFPCTDHAANTRMEVVVHFLGLLELYKQGLVELEQRIPSASCGVCGLAGCSRLRRRPGRPGRARGARWRQPASVSLADLDYRG